jgi:hypothetical protein
VTLCTIACDHWGDRTHTPREELSLRQGLRMIATVRSWYDSRHGGHGSWAKRTRHRIVGWRVVCAAASAFGIAWWLQYATLKGYPTAIVTMRHELDAYSWPTILGLLVLLLAIAVVIQFIFYAIASVRWPLSRARPEG